MAVSSAQRAQRALVSVLVSLAQAYGIALQVSRESMAAEVLKAYRQVAKRAHPDKGGRKRDFQRLQAAKEAWDPMAACVGQSALGEAWRREVCAFSDRVLRKKKHDVRRTRLCPHRPHRSAHPGPNKCLRQEPTASNGVRGQAKICPLCRDKSFINQRPA